jgi:hypothetical protein
MLKLSTILMTNTTEKIQVATKRVKQSTAMISKTASQMLDASARSLIDGESQPDEE